MLAIDPQDVDQEIALFKLAHPGRTPSRRIIYQRLLLQETVLEEIPEGYGKDAQEATLPASSALFLGPPPPLQAIEAIVEFTLQQTEEIQNHIFSFLEDPEDHLEKTMQYLEAVGIIPSAKQTTRRKSHSTTALLLRLLRHKQTVSFEELLETVQTNGGPPRQRPAATVRQFLRRHGDQLDEVRPQLYTLKKERQGK